MPVPAGDEIYVPAAGELYGDPAVDERGWTGGEDGAGRVRAAAPQRRAGLLRGEAHCRASAGAVAGAVSMSRGERRRYVSEDGGNKTGDARTEDESMTFWDGVHR